MANSAQMRQLTRISERISIARLALVGDSGQLRSVEAGQPFRQLQQAGMATARMDEVLRQRDPDLQEAVVAVREGEPNAHSYRNCGGRRETGIPTATREAMVASKKARVNAA